MKTLLLCEEMRSSRSENDVSWLSTLRTEKKRKRKRCIFDLLTGFKFYRFCYSLKSGVRSRDTFFSLSPSRSKKQKQKNLFPWPVSPVMLRSGGVFPEAASIQPGRCGHTKKKGLSFLGCNSKYKKKKKEKSDSNFRPPKPNPDARLPINAGIVRYNRSEIKLMRHAIPSWES